MGVPEREVKRGAAARLRPLPQEGLLDLNLAEIRNFPYQSSLSAPSKCLSAGAMT